MNRAENISIGSDDTGYIMIVQDDLGGKHTFDIQGVVFDFYAEVQKEIRPYVLEAENARDGLFRQIKNAEDALAIEDTGYALDDPKHPTYHERMVD